MRGVMSVHEISFNDNYWTPIPGHYPYEAYPTGEIRNMKTKRIMTQQTKSFSGNGYEQTYKFVHLRVDGRDVYPFIHRLIAMTFLPWPTGDLDAYDVDHIDRDPTNNDILNLRWLPKEINRALKSGIKPATRRRIVEEYFKTI